MKRILFMIVLMFFGISFTYAECTTDEIEALKEEVKNIKITYKHMGRVEKEGTYYYDDYSINVKNLPDDFYIPIKAGTDKITSSNSNVVLSYGQWKFDVYSSSCDVLLDSIEFKLPKFNEFSLDPLCENVDPDDFHLCGKFYDYDVNYDDFVKRVKQYRQIHGIDNKADENSWYDTNIKPLVEFIIKYKWYVGIGFFALILGIVGLTLWLRVRKRGVLK